MDKDDDGNPKKAIGILNESYRSYMAALGKVLEQSERAIPYLIDGLSSKHAEPIALALGYLMDKPGAEKSFPSLLDWVISQSPVRIEALNALVRADQKVLPELLDRLRRSAQGDDDEAVRHLLDLGVQLSENSQEKVVSVILEFLDHENPHIREAAADAISRLGPPRGSRAAKLLSRLATSDSDPAVRSAADEALTRLGVRSLAPLSAG